MAWCGTYPLPRLCNRWFNSPYRWPFVQGAPRILDFRMDEDEVFDDTPNQCCYTKHSHKAKRRTYDRAHEITDKTEAVVLMQRDGLQLEFLDPSFQADIDVV